MSFEHLNIIGNYDIHKVLLTIGYITIVPSWWMLLTAFTRKVWYVYFHILDSYIIKERHGMSIILLGSYLTVRRYGMYASHILKFMYKIQS